MLQSLKYDYSSFHTAVCRITKGGILLCGNMHLGFMAIVSMCCLLSFAACDIEDERDVCCRRVVMEYCYMSGGRDQFKENIHSLRHFLFDADERFVAEIPAASNLKLQNLDALQAGKYTMVTVGNATDATRLEVPPVDEPLSGFMLHLADTDGRNADALYYGIGSFDLTDKDANREQHFVTQMANVHCNLRVTVKWQNLPPAMTSAPVYRMMLENCAENYELNGKQGYQLGEKQFPHSPAWKQEHLRDCALKGLLLKEEFVSLRYTNSNVPTLRLFCKTEEEYVELTKPLDLQKAFNVWGYRPENTERQNYKIVVTVYMDGRIGVKVEAEAGVADWIEGGSFG